MKYSYFKKIYLTHRWDHKGTTTPGLSRPKSNGTERVLHIPQTSITRLSVLDTV